MNRVIKAIDKMNAVIFQKNISQAKLNTLHKDLDMDLMEYVKFQELKSLASMNGKLTMEESMTIYGYLGNTVEHFNNQDVAVKSVLTQIFMELMK